MSNIGLYIIHNPALKEREIAINNIIETLGIQPHLIWSKSVEALTDEDNLRFTDYVTKTQRSLVLNHECALRDALSRNYDYVIVVEDDAYCTRPELLKILINNIIEKKLPDFHSIYLGCGCLPDIYNHIKVEGNFSLLKVPSSRCTEAILYSREGIKINLLGFLNVINYPLDFHFNEFYSKQPEYLNYHMHPHPIIQYGFKSTIIMKNAEKNEEKN
jgi:hypothetical protein